MSFISVAFYLIIAFGAWLSWDIYKKRKHPPGPLRLPFVGNIIQVALGGANPFKALDNFKKYGDVVSLRVGAQDAILLTSAEAIHDLFSRDEFGYRFYSKFLSERSFGKNLGIIFANGELWDVTRKFSLRSLREFGYGKTSSVTDELDDLINLIKSKLKGQSSGEILNLKDLLGLSVLNLVWTYITGKKHTHDDKNVLRLIGVTNEFARAGNFANSICFAYPSIREWIPSFLGLNLDIMTKLNEKFHAFFRDVVDEQKNMRTNDEPIGLIDLFLLEIEKNKNDKDTFFTEENLIITSFDLFAAASETTVGSLSFIFLYLIYYPEVQKKIQEEIDRVGKDRRIVWEDRNELPYVQATCLEISRINSIIYLPPPRMCINDFSYKGMIIPKQTPIISNLYSVYMNEKIFENPEEFRPERFLDPNGNLVQNKNMINFGLGARKCPGAPLAEMTIFLYVTNILQKFSFEKVGGENLSLDPVIGFTSAPQPYKVLVKYRK